MIALALLTASLASSTVQVLRSVGAQVDLRSIPSRVVVADPPPGWLICEPVASGGACFIHDMPLPATVTAAPDDTTGDIVVTAQKGAHASDPLRRANEASFEAVGAVDNAVLKPVALAYKQAAPQPIRDGIRNFLNNLHEPVVALNFLVQLKPGKAAETLGRLGVNSTVGIAGFIDVAKRRPINLPRRPNGFADSFGYYGVKPGPYLFLPIVGPTTVRDLVGGTIDGLVLPFGVGRPFNRIAYTLPTGMLRGLDRRIAFDETLSRMKTDGSDLYAGRRALYLHQRQSEIDGLRGRAAD